jgi:HSP20 family protein
LIRTHIHSRFQRLRIKDARQLKPFEIERRHADQRQIKSSRFSRQNAWLLGINSADHIFARQTPSVDISETDEDIVVEAELPGVEPGDVHVDLTGDVLTIKGEKKKRREEKGEGLYRSERYYGSYERSFRLPAKVKEDKIEAAFDKGILKIKLPKVEEAKKKTIEIKVK